MRILVTGSSGHLGEALVRTLRKSGHQPIGIDIVPSPCTDHVSSLVDRAAVRACMAHVDAVLHTATLHKPHVDSHTRQEFVDTNITGTLNLLEEAAAAGVSMFIFTSTTSAFGRALTPVAGDPAVWITEDVRPIPKNIYGATKVAAEDLCELFQRDTGMPCLILRTSRFFPEQDDDARMRASYSADNAKVNELLYRRVDLEDVVTAHVLALEKAPQIGFARYIISATTPFVPADLRELGTNAPAVVSRYFPNYEAAYRRRGWTMFPRLDRVYVNERARRELGWRPRYDFAFALARLEANEEWRSPLALAIGAKGYHPNGASWSRTKGATFVP